MQLYESFWKHKKQTQTQKETTNIPDRVGKLENGNIAKATNPIMMAEAMKDAVIAGRLSYLAGRMNQSLYANASTPNKNKISR